MQVASPANRNLKVQHARPMGLGQYFAPSQAREFGDQLGSATKKKSGELMDKTMRIEYDSG
jgi:hypothetical protein